MARNRVVRRSGGLVRGRSVGRLTEWFGTVFSADFTPIAANTFLVQLVLTAAELAKRPFTITRTVGELVIRSDQAAAVEFPFGAVGGMVVSDKAVATGATAIPDPTTEVSSDEWFLYFPWGAPGDASTNVGQRPAHYPFDSRAQRKVVDGEQIVFVVGNANGTDGASFFLNLRMLVKLS